MILADVIPVDGERPSWFRPEVFDNISAADFQRDEMVQCGVDAIGWRDAIEFVNPVIPRAVPVTKVARSRAAYFDDVGRVNGTRGEGWVG
jgi:hypothetical protein